jgi:hypothetical protein
LIVIEQVDVEIRMDQLVLDELPDDPCHLVAVHFDDRILDLDFRHDVLRLPRKALNRQEEAGRTGPPIMGSL